MTRRAALTWTMPGLVGLAVLAPLLFTARGFGADLPDHLWLVGQQMRNIEALGHPTYYVQSVMGAFYPWFAFYGGTYSALAGGIAALAGSADVGLVAVVVIAVACAQGGWSWLARQAGVRGWMAHVPGAVHVTSAYYVALPYGRGDVPELVATSMIPLLVSSGTALVRSSRWRAAPAAAFLFATVMFTGTHPITALWGATFMVLVGVVALVARGRPSRATVVRLAQLAGLALVGVAVNSWFLAITVLHHSDVRIAGADLDLGPMTRLSMLLNPLRSSDAVCCPGSVSTALPVVICAWIAVVAVLARREAGRQTRRWAAGLVVILGAFFVLMWRPLLLEHLPHTFRMVQFPYRLDTYAVLAIAALALVAVRQLPRTRATSGPRVRAALGASLAALVVLGVGQSLHEALAAPDSVPNRRAATSSSWRPPPSWYIGPDYGDISRPVVAPSSPAVLRFDVRGPVSDGYVAHVPRGTPAGATVVTNVPAGPYLVDLDGARPVGRTSDERMVVRVDRGAGSAVRVSATRSAAARGARLVTFAALGIGLLWLLWLALRGRPAGRSRR